MKTLPSLLLSATLLAGIALPAGAETSINYAVVFCKAKVIGSKDTVLSVTLPMDTSYTDIYGDPMIVWDMGTVAPGGVVDSFFSEGGPGRFKVRNNGNCAAYVYVTSGGFWDGNEQNNSPFGETQEHGNEYFLRSAESAFGNNVEGWGRCVPTQRDYEEEEWAYRAAISTSVDTKYPVWRNLEYGYEGGNYDAPDPMMSSASGADWYKDSWAGFCGQYLAYLPAGETQLFDVKFWLPRDMHGDRTVVFPIRIEAAAFPRWDHGK